MKIRILASALTLASTLAVMAAGQDPVPPKIAPWNAASHVGEVATLCGRVVAISCRPEDRSARFEMDVPHWAGGVDIVITAADRMALDLRVGGFLLQRVCAVGTLEGRVLTTPSQLVVEEPATKLPAGFAEAFTECDAGVSPPVLIRDVKPQYTADAMRAKKQGTVRLSAVVLPTGAVGDIVVAVSLDPEYGLDKEAVAALRGWRFRPGTQFGRPVPVVVSADFAFNLSKK